jgi:hypothetical protein
LARLGASPNLLLMVEAGDDLVRSWMSERWRT